MIPFLVTKLEWLTESRFVPEEDFGIYLSFPSVGSPKHKVLEVGLLKGHVQLKDFPSPLLVELDWKDQVCPSTRVVGAADISKTCSPGSGGYGRVTGFV